MKIAIDVADLDCERIDGTRVYIQNVLKYLGKLAPEDEFFLFHKMEYNKLLRPAEFKNYYDRSLGKGFWWTQIKFARAVRKLKPRVCWMPIQQIPFLNFSAQGGPAWGWQFSIFPPKADQPGADNFQSILNVLIFNFKLIFNRGKVRFRKGNVSSNLTPPHPTFRERRDDSLYPTFPLHLRFRGINSQLGETGTGGGTKYVVTIHDLAFKKELFPDHFPLIGRLKINFYTNVAVKRADKIIAISEATKRDLIKFYPKIDEKKIVVVRHGFDRENFEQEFGEEEKRVFVKKYNLIKEEIGGNIKIQNSQPQAGPPGAEKFKPGIRRSRIQNYLLYVGAIQPRKDLVTLIKAFNKLKFQDTRYKIQTNSKIQDTRYKQIPRYNASKW